MRARPPHTALPCTPFTLLAAPYPPGATVCAVCLTVSYTTQRIAVAACPRAVTVTVLSLLFSSTWQIMCVCVCVCVYCLCPYAYPDTLGTHCSFPCARCPAFLFFVSQAFYWYPYWNALRPKWDLAAFATVLMRRARSCPSRSTPLDSTRPKTKEGSMSPNDVVRPGGLA